MANDLVLIGTPRSHFARKVRLLMDHLGISYVFEDAGDVSSADPERFGGNPMMSVPVLKAGERSIYDSDHIAKWVVQEFDPQDTFGVSTVNADRLNAHAVLNAMMSAEVRLLMARRMGLETDGQAYFDKSVQVIARGLDWLSEKSGLVSPSAPAWLEFHFISLWDHLTVCDLLPAPFPELASIAAVLHAQDRIALSAPPGLAV